MKKCKFFFSKTTSDTTVIEDYDIDTEDLPAQRHTLYAQGYDSQGYKVTDSMYVWVFTFDIDEMYVTKYFNPLKPDSARIKFEIKPKGYASPDSLPNPISMQVEIRDKDSILVYGPRPLTYDEIKYQVLYWDGRDNWGQVVDASKSPYSLEFTLTYQEQGRLFGCTREKTKTTVVPLQIVKVEPTDFDPELAEGQKYRETEIEFKTPKDLLISANCLFYAKDKNGVLFCEKEFIPEFVREESDGKVWRTKWDGRNTAGNKIASYLNSPYELKIGVKVEGYIIEFAATNVDIVAPLALGYRYPNVSKYGVTGDDWFKVYIPDKYGGRLEATISKPGLVEIYKKNMIDRVSNPYESTIDAENEHGWYYIKVSGVNGEYAIGTEFTQEGEASKTPWSGWWWPDKLGELGLGYKPGSAPPLEKYDNYHFIVRGWNPNKQDWYLANVYDSLDESSHGYCDAYSAAAILEDEPLISSSHQGILFYVGDKKGLLSQMYHPFYFYQDYGTGNENHNDVHAGTFHQILVGQIRNEMNSIILDLDNGNTVWSHPIWKFTSSAMEIGRNSERHWLHITTEIEWIDYAEPDFADDPIIKKKSYEYLLGYNDKGDPDRHKWLPNDSYQPDFIIVPLGPSGTVDPIIVRQICE